MVTVVFEGPDGGGKSTLINHVQQTLKARVVRSEGPEKYPGEINDRISRYLQLNAAMLDCGMDVLYDRHPCVSQIAYGLVHQQSAPDSRLVTELYNQKPLFIYCRPDPAGGNHTATGEWDTAEYLAKVNENFGKLMAFYDKWALFHAHMIYRIGDSMDGVLHFIESMKKE